MRILIYGAGVIGCLYAALLSEAGYDVSVYARGRRLEGLRNNGLLYKDGKEVSRKYGFNIKSQLLKLLVIFPAVSALAAWICSLLS